MLTMDKIRAELDNHGVIYEEFKPSPTLEGMRCYVYGYMDIYDIILWTDEAGAWYLIDPADNAEELTEESLRHWLGY